MPAATILTVLIGGHLLAETAKLLIGPEPFTGSALFGAGVGKLCDSLPDWLKERLGRKTGEPNYWFAAAFHTAFLKTMEAAAKGLPLTAFQKDHPGASNALHRAQTVAMEIWFKELKAATERPAAGTHPIVEVQDAFLKELLEQAGPASTARDTLATALRASLTKRLITDASHLDPDA